MNVLVTNAHTPQAYAIVRALRPLARRLVAAYEGNGRLAALAHAANSRLVDAKRRVPSLVEDWSSGRLATETTPNETAYIDAVARICEQERIDVVFPSWDPYVLGLSKHVERFERMGVTIPVPPFGTAPAAFDKYRAVEAAQAVGFPCPRTYLYQSREQLASIAAREAFPLVVKPRFTSGGHGMAIVTSLAELEDAAPRIAAAYGSPMIQEYIPGGRRDSVQFVVSRDGRIVFAFHKRRIRTFRRTARFGTVSESVSPEERRRRTEALVGRAGWWGAMGVETIHDPRDGVDKLMEINPRFPRQVWNRIEVGINEPELCIRIARGERVEPVPACPDGVLFVSPVEDVGLLVLQVLDLAVYRWRTTVGGHEPLDATCAPLPLVAQFRSFARTYASRQRKVLDPYLTSALRDPLPSVLWWAQFTTWLAGGRRQLGR